jgi:hypothetical protein
VHHDLETLTPTFVTEFIFVVVESLMKNQCKGKFLQLYLFACLIVFFQFVKFCFIFMFLQGLLETWLQVWLLGGCIVGWTNFGVTQSIFLPPKCGSNYYVVLYIMELLNGTHFEIIKFNTYVMKLIGM